MHGENAKAFIVLKEGQRASNVGVFREGQGQRSKKEHCTAQILVRLLALESSVAFGLALTVRLPQHLRGIDRQFGARFPLPLGRANSARLPFGSANTRLAARATRSPKWPSATSQTAIMTYKWGVLFSDGLYWP